MMESFNINLSSDYPFITSPWIQVSNTVHGFKFLLDIADNIDYFSRNFSYREVSI